LEEEMKLKKVHIQNFRSIVDSGVVDIEEGVTVIIGKNEQGKTTLLKGIRAFNEDQTYTPNDLPNHLRPSLEDKRKSEIPVTTLWFELDSKDRAALSDVEGLDKASELGCRKSFDNGYKFFLTDEHGKEKALQFSPPDVSNLREKIKKILADLRTKFEAHYARVPTFALNTDRASQLFTSFENSKFSDLTAIDNGFKTFAASIKNLTAQDESITDDITNAIKELDVIREEFQPLFKHDRFRRLWSLIPIFVLHSTTADQIPNEVNIADFLRDPEGTSRGMAKLCKAAGLDVQKIKELATTSETEQRQAYEDHYQGHISGGLNESQRILDPS
jgi:predicted ATP-dependent endonuclease of OLD family